MKYHSTNCREPIAQKKIKSLSHCYEGSNTILGGCAPGADIDQNLMGRRGGVAAGGSAPQAKIFLRIG